MPSDSSHTSKRNSERESQNNWLRCTSCHQVISCSEFVVNVKVCPRCNFHSYLTTKEWIEILLDKGSFKEYDSKLTSTDPLKFIANKSYTESLKQAQEKTGLKEAALTGEGILDENRIVLGILDFQFVGGSMGSVVGEKVTRLIEKATKDKLPLFIIASSGGARMQEGMYSLMQMAKTSAALGRFKSSKMPYISILTNPTTGGVTASFAILADIIIAEPHALIGFAGPRVIEKTIKQRLPKGFQTAEFLLEHGMVDMVVHRKNMKETISRLLDFTIGE